MTLLPLLLLTMSLAPDAGVPLAPTVPALADVQAVVPVRKSRPIGAAVVDVLVMASAAEGERHAGAALDEVERVVTLFDPRSAEGDLARLRDNAGKDAVVVDPEVFAVLVELQRIAKLSKGAFDVTAAAYDAAWSPDPASPTTAREPPQRGEVDRLRQLVSVDDLVLDPVARTARLKKAGERIDLHAVIMGYALDRARALLLAGGVVDFVLSCAGDVVVNGKKGDSPWMVGVQDPRAPGPFLALPVDTATLGGAVMSSSDNENFFFAAGVRYHSIIDPRTGLPATRSRSVTVLHDDPLVAEALSRAVFVLGYKEGLKLIERLPGANAVVVTSDNRVVLSKGLQKLARTQALQQHPPTDGP